MSKNLLLGTILGGAATYVVWKCLSDKQKNDIKKNVCLLYTSPSPRD